MADTQVSMSEARQQLARLVNRVAYGGERIMLEAHGEPKAALVSIEDLERLQAEPAARPSATDVLQRLAALRERIGQRMEAAGIQPGDSTEMIRQMREERDDEIGGLR
jgi:prevent-host-death family protein